MVAIGVVAFISIWALSGLVDRVDRLPIVGGLLELVGLVVTGWFAYRYLTFAPDRYASAAAGDTAILLDSQGFSCCPLGGAACLLSCSPSGWLPLNRWSDACLWPSVAARS